MDSKCTFSAWLLVSDDDQSWPWIDIYPSGARYSQELAQKLLCKRQKVLENAQSRISTS